MFYKKKYNIHTFLVYCALFIIVFTGCAKVDTTRTTIIPDTTSQTTIASDEMTVNSEFDQAIDDAIAVLSNHNAKIAGAIADSISPTVYEIDYYSKEENGTKSRLAGDSIHLNAIPWGNTGATASVSFGDANNPAYEVLFLTNNTSLTFSGKATITNVYGGLLQNLVPGDSLVVHIRGSISFTYNDNAAIVQSYTWNFNQLRTFTVIDTNTNASTRGDTIMNGYSGIGTWGTTRLGTAFYTSISAAITQNISDPYLSYNPLSGKKNIEGIAQPIVSIYGVNSQGIMQASGTPYGFYNSWVNGSQQTLVVPYYY